MILEGLVTTIDAGGVVNLAPMGPQLDPPYFRSELSHFTLKPYPTSRTLANLRAVPEGVLHVTDDVLVLARAAVGAGEPLPDLTPATRVRGSVLRDACRAYEFRVVAIDATGDRVRLRAEVAAVHRLRDFFGFNRAMHAVVEAAILATRTAFLPLDDIDAEFRRLAVLVNKTGSPREHEAFALLQRHVEAVRHTRLQGEGASA